MSDNMQERIKRIYEQSKQSLVSDKKIRRVEIFLLKYKEEPTMINDCIARIVNHTTHPYKLVVFDNRLNPPNTSKIWNKLIKESTCDYVLIIDSDAFVPIDIKPCWLSRLMESIEETGIAVPVGNVDGVGGCNRDTEAAKYPASERANGVCSGYCFLLKKSVLFKTKMFDENYNVYGQDSSFFLRTLKIPGVIMRTDCFVKHLGGSSFKQAEKDGAFDREADKLYAKNLFNLDRIKYEKNLL